MKVLATLIAAAALAGCETVPQMSAVEREARMRQGSTQELCAAMVRNPTSQWLGMAHGIISDRGESCGPNHQLAMITSRHSQEQAAAARADAFIAAGQMLMLQSQPRYQHPETYTVQPFGNGYIVNSW